MWGSGGQLHWGRRERGGAKGIVVLFACLSSSEHGNLKPYVDLCGSLGWNSLVCRVEFLALFSPEKAASLASRVLNELIEEIDIKAQPIVLTSFSGGSKGCLYKVLQLVEGKCEGQLSKNDRQRLRDCICGQLYDSSPVDFTSDVGTRFVLHHSVIKMSLPPRIASLIAKGFASGLDTLFLNRFEAQRAEYWQTLLSSINLGPYLILCSEDDDIAPYQVVCNFAHQLQELGGDVKLVKWETSPHVAHYKHHEAEYRAAVTEFLTKVEVISTRRSQSDKENRSVEGTSSETPDSVGMPAACLDKSPIGPNDDFFLPSLMEFNERESDSPTDERKTDLFQLPTLNPHGVLSQILFDVCVPKNIEGWDIKPGMSLNGKQPFSSGRRHMPLNPLKFMRRSRL